MASGTVNRNHRKRIVIGIAVAVVALLVVATTVFAAGPGRGGGAMNGGGFGPRAVVTAVDTTNQTITLGGLPQQIATVKIDQSVKLVAIQPDGTTKDAAIGDFKAGSLVEVNFTFNGQRGMGRGKGKPNQATQTAQPSQPSQPTTQGQPMVTVTQIGLVGAGQVRVEGLVTANSGGTLQIVSGGGLQLTISTTGTTKVTKGPNTAAASVNDIKVGDRIVADGTQNGATVTATTLRIADLSGMKPSRGSATATP